MHEASSAFPYIGAILRSIHARKINTVFHHGLYGGKGEHKSVDAEDANSTLPTFLDHLDCVSGCKQQHPAPSNSEVLEFFLYAHAFEY